MNSIVKNKLPLSLSLLLTLLALLLLAACGPSAGPQELTLTAKFEAGKLTPETLQAKQGDMVTLQIETDRPGSFHLHGYDLEEEGSGWDGNRLSICGRRHRPVSHRISRRQRRN